MKFHDIVCGFFLLCHILTLHLKMCYKHILTQQKCAVNTRSWMALCCQRVDYIDNLLFVLYDDNIPLERRYTFA